MEDADDSVIVSTDSPATLSRGGFNAGVFAAARALSTFIMLRSITRRGLDQGRYAVLV